MQPRDLGWGISLALVGAGSLLMGYLKGAYPIRGGTIYAEKNPIAFSVLSSLYFLALVVGLAILAGFNPNAVGDWILGGLAR